jgi:hypothetical protein
MFPRIPRTFPIVTLLFTGAGVLVALALVGCSSGDFPDDTTKPDAMVPLPPGTPDAGPPATGPSTLPFAVDDWFGPSGYMGDGESPGGIKDVEVCASPRPDTWIGNCHQFTWTPGVKMWAGVFWQGPDHNWGDMLGLTMPTGATKVTFEAWGAVGGEVVSFGVGMKSVDGFEAKLEKVTLNATPTQYTIDLSGASYGRVVGGFSWAADMSTVPVTFNVDDIRWAQ